MTPEELDEWTKKLDPRSPYLIVINKNMVSMNETDALRDALSRLKIAAAIVRSPGDPLSSLALYKLIEPEKPV